MLVRLRNSESLGNYFNATPLCTVDMEQGPQVGDLFQDTHESYRIVKVLDDVDPEHGSDQRGSIAFVMRVGVDADACRIPVDGTMALSYQISTAREMRQCIERAHDARAMGNVEQYRRHVEEFLFLSHTISRDHRLGDHQLKALSIPYIPIFNEQSSVTSAIREGFIDHCFAAHVAHVGSLSAVTFALDRMDTARPTIFIISGPMTLGSGLMALHLIRTHPKSGDCQILVLVPLESRCDEIVALAAGADACAIVPTSADACATLADHVRDLLLVTARGSHRLRLRA